MTRVLFWNIEQFQDEKFFSVSTTDDSPNTGGQKMNVAADARRAILYASLEAADPDIFVIVEVQSSLNKNTRLPSINKGLAGNVWLLEQLRGGSAPGAIRSADWRLVPPFWLAGDGNSGLESVAVFYRGTRGGVTRYFTGPNVWSGGLKGKPVRPGGGVLPQAYNNVIKKNVGNVDVNAMLVPPATVARTIPVGALHNPGLAENVVAARFAFLKPDTTAVAFGKARPPLMATFTEQSTAGLRHITVLAVHGPRTDAAGFIGNLALAEEVAGAPGIDETRVIVGDFNINLLAPDGTLAGSYDPLTTAGYSILLRPAGGPPEGLDAYKGYFATVIDDVTVGTEQEVAKSKLFWSESDQNLSYYPAYGYAALGRNLSSLDNILVKPRDANRAYNTSILNFVMGAPLDGIENPPGNPPLSTIDIPVGITGGWPQLPTAEVFDATKARVLQEWGQYGHLRAASDHFALFADV